MAASGRWVLKGGFALDLRLGTRARATKDVDLARSDNVERATADLLAAQATDLGDHFVFAIERTDDLDDVLKAQRSGIVSRLLSPDAGLSRSSSILASVTLFKTFSGVQSLFAKMQFSCPEKHSSVIAPRFTQINTFLYGGITQHGEFVGNVCADLNGMGGGARAFRDGENSMAPFFVGRRR